MKFTHRSLCIRAARYLRNKGIHRVSRGQYSVCELERVGESPDAFAWGGGSTQLIEVKVSRSDYLSDNKKPWRKHPEYGLGEYRSYLCPSGLIKYNEVPENWGLLYLDEFNQITEIKNPMPQRSNHREEINLITSILRRENIRPKVFNYKRYKSDEIYFQKTGFDKSKILKR